MVMPKISVHVGDKIRVRLIEIDKEKGRLKVSLRAMKEKPADWVDRPARPRRTARAGI